MRKKMRKIFVTGSSGFVGKNLLKWLQRENAHEIFALSRTKLPRCGKNIIFLQGNLLAHGNYERHIAAADVIIHLAGTVNINDSVMSPAQTINDRVSMLFRILEVVRKTKKRPLIVFISTDRVYGKTNKKEVNEKDVAAPIEPYTASKIMGEVLLQTYNLAYDIPYIILRCDSIYGPHQPKKMFISDIIQKMLTQDSIAIGDLSIKKNFVYVDDVAQAIILSLKAPKSSYNQVYNIGGKPASLANILKMVRSIVEKRLHKKIIVHFDSSLVRKGGIEVNPFQLSTKKARRYLGWKQATPLKEGLEKTVYFFMNNQK